MDYRDLAYKTAVKYGIDPDLFVRQIAAESNFNPAAKSSAGAIGLGQLMPATARELGVDPNDPVQNLDGAARYMKQQLQRFGDPALALAAYNAGPSRVAKAQGIPNIKETQNYVSKILGGQPMAQQPSMQPMAQQPSMQRQAGGLLSGPLGMSNRDAMLFEAAFNAGRPDGAGNAMVSLLNSEIKQRDALDQLETNRQMAAQSRNVTADYLDKMGQVDLAQLLRDGGIDASTAFAAAGNGKPTALMKQAEAAGLTKGTPEYAQYILSGGNIYSQETSLMANLPTAEKGKMYEFDRDENGKITNVRLVNISGSKADIEEQERQKKLQKAARMESRGQSVVSRSVKEALDIINNNKGLPAAGAFGKFLADYTPNAEARDLKRVLESLQANTAFTRLQEMREASQTGGALGNVSNVELNLLMSAYGSIHQDLTPDRLKKHLEEIERIMGQIENDPVANAYYTDGVDLRGTDLDKQVKQGNAGSNSGQSSTTRLRFDAQGNLIND